LEQGLHANKFGIKNFRMLTITLTAARAKNLCGLAASSLPERAKKYYFFTSIENFSLENPAPILESVYLSPRNCEPGVYFPLVAAPSHFADRARSGLISGEARLGFRVPAISSEIH